jgi:hypothetical protein
VERGTEVAIINPREMVKDIDNNVMKAIAEEIFEKLKRVINNL